MTITEILEQVKTLSPQERDALLDQLLAMRETASDKPAKTKTCAEIVAMLEKMGPIEFVDPHIEDPVEWVKAQRQKRVEKLKPYWDWDENQ